MGKLGQLPPLVGRAIGVPAPQNTRELFAVDLGGKIKLLRRTGAFFKKQNLNRDELDITEGTLYLNLARDKNLDITGGTLYLRRVRYNGF